MGHVSPLQIVRAGLRDVEALTPLFEEWRKFYRRAANAGEAAAFLSKRLKNRDCAIFYARHDLGDALGYILIYPAYSSLEMSRIIVLNDMFVAEHARRQGIARALLERARIFAHSTGATRVDVSLKPENEGAIRLYEHLGYRIDEFTHWCLTV